MSTNRSSAKNMCDTNLSAALDGGLLVKRTTAIMLLTLCFAFSMKQLSRNWNQPILDNHAFRQTQTALTAYWIAEDGFRIDYETPVFGPPWKIPLEFPTYQGLVAAISKATSYPLDQTGRFVSVAFYYLTLIPFYFILRAYSTNNQPYFLFAAFYLTSPFYLFWSRCFMIESTALFLAASTVALWTCTERKSRAAFAGIIFTALVTGTIAAITKVTTFCIFATFAASVALLNSKNLCMTRKELFNKIVSFVTIFGIPLLIAVIWAHYGDRLKAESPTDMARMLITGNLTSWNFGHWTQRFSLSSWQELSSHAFERLFQSPIPFAIALALSIIMRSKSALEFSSLAAFLIGPVVFLNLFRVHDYYWYANGILGILFLAVVSARLIQTYHLNRIGVYFTVGVLVFYQTISVFTSQYRDASSVFRNYTNSVLATAEKIKSSTNSTDTLLIYGHGWNSSIPYYSERRALMILKDHQLFDQGTLDAVNKLNDEESTLRLFVCWMQARNDTETIAKAIAHFGFAPTPIFKSSFCDIYSKESH